MPILRIAATVAAAAALAAGCTGERGSLSAGPVAPATGGDAGTPVGDEAIDAVLAGLERPLATSFTATYAVTRKLGATRATAVVSRGPLATSVTIGDVRYLLAEAGRTCLLGARTCEDGVNEARVSDLGLSSAFWRDAPARALRVTFGRRAGPATGETATIAGQEARCVAVPVGTGTERYCSLPAGALARMDTAYVTVELTAYEPSVRQEAFALPVEDPPVGG